MKVIHVRETTTLAEVLSEAAKQPVVIERDGTNYELHLAGPPADLFAHYDAAAAIAALDHAAAVLGPITPAEAEQWKAEVKAARGQAGRTFDD